MQAWFNLGGLARAAGAIVYIYIYTIETQKPNAPLNGRGGRNAASHPLMKPLARRHVWQLAYFSRSAYIDVVNT